MLNAVKSALCGKKLSVFVLVCCMAVFGSAVVSAADKESKGNKEKGLVGYWNFNEGQGNVVKDSSGNGNDGKLSENMDTKTCWVNGISGKALYFRGGLAGAASGYVDCGNSSYLEVKSSFTYEAWVKLDSIKDFGIIIGKQQLSKRNLFVADWGDKYLFCYVPCSTTAKSASARGGIVPTGAWTHVAMVFKYPTAYLYMNGKEVSYALRIDASGPEEDLTSSNLLIGGLQNSYQFNGAIDEVKIYNRALTAEEIKSEYDSLAKK